MRLGGRVAQACALLGVAALTGAAARSLHLPVPWFLGGLAGAAALCALRPSLQPEKALRDAGFVLVGYGVGRDLAVGAGGAAATGASLPLYIGTGACGALLSWIAASTSLRMFAPGWSRSTRGLAAIPGSMTPVLAVAASRDCALEQVALVHLLRLAVLCVVLPLLSVGALAPVPPTPTPFPLPALLPMLPVLAVAGLASLALSRVRVPAGALFASIACGVAANIWFPLPPLPPVARALSALLIAAYLAPSFARAARSLRAASVLPALAAAAGALLAGTGVALLLWLGVGADWRALVLGLAPGGLEVAVLTAASSGTDPGLVIVLQLTRYAVALILLTLLGHSRKALP